MKIDWAPLAELTAPQNIERMSSDGDFPRPETNTLARNSGPNGEVAHSGTRAQREVGDGVRRRGEAGCGAGRHEGRLQRVRDVRDGLRRASAADQTGQERVRGLGATVIDSLDTLWIMGLKDQYSRARNWVADRLHFDRNYEASVFETTIRVCRRPHRGARSQRRRDVPRKVPRPRQAPQTRVQHRDWDPVQHRQPEEGLGQEPHVERASTLAEFGTLQMEYIALSERTGDDEWRQLAESIVETVRKIRTQTGTPLGLYPLYLNPHRGTWENTHVSFGAMGDSWYEYLLKVWVQGGRTKAMKGWHDMWEESMRAMIDKLVFDGEEEGTKYVAEYNANHAVHKMDHLTCFVGGMLVLSARERPRGRVHEGRGGNHQDVLADVQHAAHGDRPGVCQLPGQEDARRRQVQHPASGGDRGDLLHVQEDGGSHVQGVGLGDVHQHATALQNRDRVGGLEGREVP